MYVCLRQIRQVAFGHAVDLGPRETPVPVQTFKKNKKQKKTVFSKFPVNLISGRRARSAPRAALSTYGYARSTRAHFAVEPLHRSSDCEGGV